MKKYFFAIALASAMSVAFANGGKEPKPADKPSHECQGNSCNGYGGYGTADLAAAALVKMKVEERNTFIFNLTPSEWREVKDVYNGNQNTLTTNNPSTASSSLTGNTTTTTIGGTTYSYDQPVAGAFVQLPPGTMASGVLVVTTTPCGPDFTVEVVRNIQATQNTGAGLFTTTRDNGVVMKTIPGTAGLVYGNWVGVGRDGDQLIEERTVNGFQAVTYAYLAGSSASSGISLNGRDGSGAVAGAGGVQTFGKEIDKYACSFKETRRLTPEKTVGADDLATEIAAKLALRQKLSAPTYERKWVPCPQKGCEAPKAGYFTYVKKDGSIEASTELTTTGKGKREAETKDAKNPEKGAFITGPEIRRLAEEAVAARTK